MLKKGWTLPDGTYPIFDDRSLMRALWAFKRSPRDKREMIKEHIENRAKDLGLEEMLPDIWKGEGSYFSEEDLVFSMREKASIDKVLVAAGWVSDISDDETGIFESLFQGEIVPEEPIIEDITDISSDLGGDDETMEDDGGFDDTELATKEKPQAEEEVVAEADISDEELKKIEKIIGDQGGDLKVRKKGKYTAKTQPRDAQGKFRKVLARLKVDLGTAGLDKALKKVEEVENLDFSGDYSRAAEASKDLMGIIDRLDTKALNPESLENVRASSAELGKVIANLPFAFGEEAQKVRFSDIPPTLRDLMENMIDKVEAKIGKEDADVATADLKKFISGSEVYNQSEISSQMAKLLRLLT